MMVENNVEGSTPILSFSEKPYKPSWIDNLTSWIDQLPIPTWFFYLIAYLTVVMLVYAAAWIGGLNPFGSIYLYLAQLPIWLFLPLAYIHYLDRIARHAMKKFRPALAIDDPDFNSLSFQLTTMPAKPIWILTGIGAILDVLLLVINPSILQPLSQTTVGIAILFFTGVPAGAFGSSFVYHTVRQLRLVNNMYQRLESINLFDLERLHAFSLLTARTSILLILMPGLALFFNSILGLEEASNFLLFLFATLLSTLAIATFFLPLWGVHERLVEEKERIGAENNRRIETAMFELHRRMDDADYDGMSPFRSGISGLLSFREELKGVSTWPWQPATLRGLMAAVFLPILLWAIQQILTLLIPP
jgi:hypothetical protein